MHDNVADRILRGVRNKGESRTDFKRNPGGNPLIHSHKNPRGIQESRTLCQVVADPSEFSLIIIINIR